MADLTDFFGSPRLGGFQGQEKYDDKPIYDFLARVETMKRAAL
jgi:hypothetical protein